MSPGCLPVHDDRQLPNLCTILPIAEPMAEEDIGGNARSEEIDLSPPGATTQPKIIAGKYLEPMADNGDGSRRADRGPIRRPSSEMKTQRRRVREAARAGEART